MLCQSRTTTALTTSCGTMLDSLLHCIYTVDSHTDPALALRLHIPPYTHTHTQSECSFPHVIVVVVVLMVNPVFFVATVFLAKHCVVVAVVLVPFYHTMLFG